MIQCSKHQLTMNASWNISLKGGMTPPTPASSPDVANLGSFTKAIYCVISTVSFIGNTLVILVFVWDKKLLKKSYNMFILSLAIADMFTGITLMTSPVFITFPRPTSPFLGELFCRLLWNFFLPWQLGIFSVHICLLLTIERWFAVVKPHKYGDIFSRRKVIGCIFASWVWSCILVCSAILETVYNPFSVFICDTKLIGKGSVARVFVGVFQIIMGGFAPCLVMTGLYIHMVVVIGSSAAATGASKAKLRGKMTRMVAVTCLVLTICFAPSQIFLLLSFAGKTTLGSMVHHVLSLFTFFNSCVNPIVYGLSNKSYRHSYKKILFALCPRVLESSVGEGIGSGIVIRRQRVEPMQSPNEASNM